jgi:hypothetical protein
MLADHNNITFSTKRLGAVSGGKQAYASNLTGQQGVLQPRGDKDGLNLNSSEVIYCSNIDVLKTDTITYNGKEKKIAKVEVRPYGSEPHTKIFILKEH